jgi:hypothetical protein
MRLSVVPILLSDAATYPRNTSPLGRTIMRRTLSAVFVASSVAIAAAQGQTPAPSPQPAAPAQQPATERPAAPRQAEPATLTKTTISGCIQNVPPAAAGATSGTASKFELARVKVVTPAPVGTSGTANAAVRYQLDGDDKVITSHVNHQVEITGTVSPTSGTGSTAVPVLKVESVKMVSATCPPAPPAQ